MEKIINISYQDTLIPIDEGAYEKFVKYQEELKQFLSKEPEADEVFEDLKYRMYEILKSKLTPEHTFISHADVDEVIGIIGHPQDLYEAASGTDNANSSESKSNFSNTAEPKKLRRNQSDRMISGLCSGIANFFGMDALAIRLIAIVLLIISPVATLVFYLLGYIIPREPLQTNTSRRLFRNPNDKILGGVCGGLATLFNKETWIFRIIFLLPIFVTIVGDGDFWWFSGAMGGSSVVAYIILWIITPKANSQSDFMLMRGEAINLTNYNDPRWQEIQNKNNSGVNSFFRVLAFILVAFCLIVLIPTALSILIGGVLIHNLADIVLATPLLKVVFWISLIGFFALPVIAMMIWLVRRLMRLRRSPKLKMIFGSLIALGFVATVFLAFSLFREMRSYKTITTSMPINTSSDTLYVKTMNDDGSTDDGTSYKVSSVGWNSLVEDNGTSYDINAVMFKSKTSNDSVFKFEIIKSSLGSGRKDAIDKANAIKTQPYFDGSNTLYIPKYISFNKNTPYRGQHIKFVLHIPEGKTLIVDRSVEGLNDFRFGFSDDDKVYEWDDNLEDFRESETVTIHNDTIERHHESNDSLIEVKRSKIDSMQNAIDSINDQMDKVNDEIDDMKWKR